MSMPGRSSAATLRRITATRPQAPALERCEMCAEPLAEEHQHVVNVESRALICACRPCYLLFADEHAHLRYRAVPDRYLWFRDFTLESDAWDEMQIPVGLAFLFRNSAQKRTVAFYPGPAGATESELPLDAWERIVTAHPGLGRVLPDVEALLLVREETGSATHACFLVPIDACYALVGQLRMLWRGFDGGSEAHTAMDAFFSDIRERSKQVASTGEQAAP
ncbi:DUF5947 family protein [soil metagenome]